MTNCSDGKPSKRHRCNAVNDICLYFDAKLTAVELYNTVQSTY
jgi:hypothetical protein